ncbi:MAG: biotin/lipoyl-containing protein, partial [Verrucomicrobiia bacterium]
MAKLLIEVPIPSMGATVNEITLIDILCEAGDTVAKGDKIAELESDKSIFDFESPCDGVIREFCCRAGDILEVGVPFYRIETEDESMSHLQVDGESASTPAKAESSAAE